MIEITRVSGNAVQIDGVAVVQIRGSIKGVEREGSATRIDGATVDYCLEDVETIAKRINKERKSAKLPPLARLMLPGKQPVYFAGERAVGPLTLFPGDARAGVNSAFQINTTTTRVASTGQEVYEAIHAAGGRALPVHPSIVSLMITRLRSLITPAPRWDASS